MNMTKCEIPQPLSRSHFPGSCWGAAKIDPLSTAFGRRAAHFFSQTIYLHSVSPSCKAALSLFNVSKRQKKKKYKLNAPTVKSI